MLQNLQKYISQFKVIYCFALTAVFLQLSAFSAWAQVDGYYYDEVTPKGHFYKLMTGGFGSFVMVFMGLGGVATLALTRSGGSAKKVPIPGVIMLVIAAGVFAFRILVKGGVMGHEYLEW